MTLAERLLAIHASLGDGGVEHAFGGAIALAYWTLEPRGTRDIDVNVFTRQEECERVLAALPSGITFDRAAIERIKRDGQSRLWWEDTPVDLFFSYLPLHDEAARHRREVPFEGTLIPVLGPVELAVFKAMLDRTRDWADIEAMLAAKTLDPDALRDHLTHLAGDDDPRLGRLDQALVRADNEV
ncbi:MAG: nucleotidyl transferase AbiEii/AbiGii toxin family protein [bacterium]